MDLLKELQNRKYYQAFFDRLRSKISAEPYRSQRSPSGSNITPQWMILSEDLVTNKVIKQVKSKRYFPVPAKIKTLKLDKDRRIFSQIWPDRMVDGVLAGIIAQTIEPILSDRLFSFRKGRGNIQVIRELSSYIRQAYEAKKAMYVIKQDVASYGESIDRELLKQKLAEIFGRQDPYIDELLQSFLHPTEHLADEDIIKENGIPTGFAITPVCENLYLNDLDHQLDNIDGVFYSRFGDDIVLASLDRNKLIIADEKTKSILAEHKLEIKPEKKAFTCLFRAPSAKDTVFSCKPYIEYLGFLINERGGVFLSKKKVQDLKRDFRMTSKKAAIANRKLTRDKRLKKVIKSVSLHLEQEFRHPYLETALRILDDSEELRKLDTWIAKVCLRYIYGTGHDRVFRYKSLKELRDLGLPSIVHIKNSFWRRK